MQFRQFALVSGFASILILSGCVAPAKDPTSQEMLRPPSGIVRSVHLPERYIVFEAEFRIPEGTSMVLLQNGVPKGRLKAGAYRRRKFQSADVLEGRPQVGDLVEPLVRIQPQQTQQSQSGRLSP